MEAASKRNAAWILRSLRPTRNPFDPAYGLTVENLLPPGYAAYLKIFHAMYVDPLMKDREITWDKWARQEGTMPAGYREATEDMTDFSQATLLMCPALDVSGGARIFWRELAAQQGLVFHPEFNERSFRLVYPRSWPRYLYGPAEGFLEMTQYEELLALLASHTHPQFCYLKLSDFWKAGESVERIFRGDLREVPGHLRSHAHQRSAEYVWPEDRSWCLNSDDDLTFSILGGSSDLIEAVAKLPSLETIRVLPQARVDYQADEINRPRHEVSN